MTIHCLQSGQFGDSPSLSAALSKLKKSKVCYFKSKMPANAIQYSNISSSPRSIDPLTSPGAFEPFAATARVAASSREHTSASAA